MNNQGKSMVDEFESGDNVKNEVIAGIQRIMNSLGPNLKEKSDACKKIIEDLRSNAMSVEDAQQKVEQLLRK